MGALELGRGLLHAHSLRVDPPDAHVGAVVDARVLERLVHREVCVLELHVLPDERDLDLAAPLPDPGHELVPLPEVGFSVRQAQLVADERVETFLAQPLRHEVHVAHVLVHDHGLRVDVGEKRDFLADLVREDLRGAANDDVRVDTDAAQLIHGMLGRLRLQLAGGLDERHEGHVEVEDVLRPRFPPELADRLEEGQRLDVADRAADLRDDHVGVTRRADPADPVLDLVRDMRNHLDRRAQVLALALLPDHGVPDRSGGVVCVPREVLVDEAFVVPDVEIRLGAILSHEDLTVLEGTHRPRIDVDVRIELLNLDAQAASLEESAEGSCGNALPERRHHPSRHEDVLRRPACH